MKKCPFCAEDIQEEAIKCRFCGEFLDDKSLQEASLKKKTDRRVFNIEEVADYLRLPGKVIDNWVRLKKMPFSRLPGTRGVVFRRADIDKWITENKITEYDRFVYDKKTIDDILPSGYKPPTDDEMYLDYIQELHEKYITRHCRKEGRDEAEYARGLKKSFAKITYRVGDQRLRWDWEAGKKKYVCVRGEEEYKKTLKKDKGFQGVLFELQTLMRYLNAYY